MDIFSITTFLESIPFKYQYFLNIKNINTLQIANTSKLFKHQSINTFQLPSKVSLLFNSQTYGCSGLFGLSDTFLKWKRTLWEHTNNFYSCNFLHTVSLPDAAFAPFFFTNYSVRQFQQKKEKPQRIILKKCAENSIQNVKKLYQKYGKYYFFLFYHLFTWNLDFFWHFADVHTIYDAHTCSRSIGDWTQLQDR